MQRMPDMTKFPLTIRDHMTPAPHTISARRSLADAHALMRSQHLRHLPVLDGGKIVGVVSQRDLALVESLPDVSAAEVPVEDAMSTDLYTISPDAPLSLAATEMADRKLGSAIVVEHGAVVGMFTAVDACRALAQALSHLAR
jgi:acetoin utilization protein AcuB